jgi:hypothetical protein
MLKAEGVRDGTRGFQIDFRYKEVAMNFDNLRSGVRSLREKLDVKPKVQ